MKCNFKYFACLFVVVFCLGKMWAAEAVESTLTFTAKCNGSGTADDGATWTVTSDASESNFSSAKGIHYGTSSAEVSYVQLRTNAIPGTITKVVVNTCGDNGTSTAVSVRVGSTNFTIGEYTSSPILTSPTDFPFAGSSSGEIMVLISQVSAKKAIYCKSIVVTYESPEDDYTEVRSGLEVGRHYTACLQKQIVAVNGATIWGLSQRNDAGTIAYLEEAQLPLAAGTPFIYQATASTFEVAYEGDAATEPVESGALRGTFEDMNSTQLEAHTNVYLMYQNALRPLGTNNSLQAFRAYVLYDEMDVVNEAPQSTSGRRVRSMSMQGNEAAGIEDTESAAQAVKVMIDGKLFIRRGETLYDVTGQTVNP